MGTITALRMQPGRRRRIGVYVDGRLWSGVSLPIAGGLAVGQAVDESFLAELQDREAVEAAVQKAGRLLARRLRSEAELRQALRKAGGSEETIEAAVGRLRESGQIDDERFARAWLEDRSEFRPRSALALRAEMQRKGLARDVVEHALAGFSEDEAALEAARRAARRWRGADEAERRRHVYAYLQRRGFGHATISAAVRQVAGETAAWEESEVES